MRVGPQDITRRMARENLETGICRVQHLTPRRAIRHRRFDRSGGPNTASIPFVVGGRRRASGTKPVISPGSDISVILLRSCFHSSVAHGSLFKPNCKPVTNKDTIYALATADQNPRQNFSFCGAARGKPDNSV